ncbi:MAG: peptide-methionine (S)-S-oxide reductase MsrA [Candidatus Geothermincolia bacterium]
MNTRSIVLGGGCFWCIEAVFNRARGVVEATSGYAGGFTPDPNYGQVSTTKTGHAEVVRVEYDPDKVQLHDLLELFFAVHDPTSLNRQGADVGSQYRSIILYDSPEQRQEVERVMDHVREDYSVPLVTELKPLDRFYPAEDYHQRYYEKHPEQGYCQVVIAPKLRKAEAHFHKVA